MVYYFKKKLLNKLNNFKVTPDVVYFTKNNIKLIIFLNKFFKTAEKNY